jgi:hypothetical protein
MGWPGRKNGELLELMVKSNFEVFVSIANNLSTNKILKLPFRCCYPYCKGQHIREL